MSSRKPVLSAGDCLSQEIISHLAHTQAA